ncbi:MAG: hypothetical protein QW231_04125 [Candidatus Bathyarchaeia archaeon]
MEEFERDLDTLLGRLSGDADGETGKRLGVLKDRLVRLHEENLVKINHSVMELVCAKHLILGGYEVDVEHPLDAGGLTCDLYGVKGYGTLIVEIETGFVPPEHALDPMTYLKTRITSKITRYSNYCNKFGLGTPPHYIIQVPPTLVKPPRYRTMEEIQEIKGRCDLYYKNPPVTLEEIRNARLHTIYIIDVDEGTVQETDPSAYMEKPIGVTR